MGLQRLNRWFCAKTNSRSSDLLSHIPPATMQDTALQAERAAQVLSLVVQHSTQLHTPLKDVCALLQTHSTVRHALQQLRVAYTVELPFGPLPIKYGKTTPVVERSAVRREAWLASFTEWLPRHASLVGAIKYDIQPWEPHQEQQLAMALRLCRLQTAAEALPLLRLVSLHKFGVPSSASLLGELAYVSLQELHIESVGFYTHMPSFCEALQRLASLRHLSMLPSFQDYYEEDDEGVEQHVLASDGVVAAVAQLSRLTCLRLGLLRRECVVRFPPSLQELSIDEPVTTCGCEIVDLSHLTALAKLMLAAYAGTIPELVLPPQLT